jgi:transcriptional regulator with XRE-family HTH domain
MKASRALRWARLTAGLSQRALAKKSGIPQSSIARIEAGTIDPRVGTLDRLLCACGFDLEVEPRLGQGIDRSQIRERLALTPAERLEHISDEVQHLEQLFAALEQSRRRKSAQRKAG